MRRVFAMSAVSILLAGPCILSAQHTVLHTFSSTAPNNGLSPSQSLMQASDGNFYGSAENGGAKGYGTLFRITPSGTFTLLYTFTNGQDGAGSSSLIQAADGNLYGASTAAIFKLTLGGAFTVIYSGIQAGQFFNTLVQGTDGDLYGTTQSLSGNSTGTFFKATTAGVVTILHTFTGGDDGGSPVAALIQGADGNFYGTTTVGGTQGTGTIFKITPNGTVTTLYAFDSDGTDDGDMPEGALIEDSSGDFYGTAFFGGYYSVGTIFAASSTGDTGVPLVTFNNTNGSNPVGLFSKSSGVFYATAGGGNFGEGAIDLVTDSGSTGVTSFGTSASGGASPAAPAIEGSDGNLYGTTPYGGDSSDSGVVYKFKLSAPQAPVQLTLSEASINLGSPVTLSWQVLNAFSMTMQQCYAAVQGSPAGAGKWTGKQAGALSKGIFAGSATLTPTAAGTFTYALTCGGVESGFVTLKVTNGGSKSNTTTSLTASPNPASVGQQITLKATVTKSAGSATPTGTVTFRSGSLSIGSSAINGSGVASLAASSNGLPPGVYPVTATYSGDANFNPSASTGSSVTLHSAATVTTLVISPTSVTPPQDVTLTATVKRAAGTGMPTGQVSFYDSTIKLITVGLNGSGVAKYTTSTSGVAAGMYSITAMYAGDASDTASTSAAASVTVK
jgi:uncharacterized repeat protein (TIGR03803 family)